jgi:hypothetical protein
MAARPAALACGWAFGFFGSGAEKKFTGMTRFRDVAG